MPRVMLTGSPLRPPWRNTAESHLTGIVLLPFRRYAKPRVWNGASASNLRSLAAYVS